MKAASSSNQKIISTPENLQVLYEDNHIIAINKRPGDIVQGDKTGDTPLSEVVKGYIKKNTINLELYTWELRIG